MNAAILTDTPIRASRNAFIAENLLGRMVSLTGRSSWKHPWTTTPFWQPQRKAWAAVVLAGFVNGIAPVVRTTVGDLKNARGTFYGQLVDASTGAAEIAQLAQLAIGNGDDAGLPLATAIDVPIYQNPPVQLTFRNLGFDGSDAVPQFFLDRGVSKPPPQPDPLAVLAGDAELPDSTPPKNNRLLRACDVVLHQPRTALTSSIELTPDDGVLLGTHNVVQTLGIADPAPGDRLKIFAANQFQPPQPFSGATDLLADDYEEPTYDETVIGTVFLLSPPNTPPGSAPDASWQPFVRHQLFWNLHYGQPPFVVLPSDLFTDGATAALDVLAGGTASLVINGLVASLNDAAAAALNIVESHSLAGSFWTPTGGGTTSAFPDPPATPAKQTNDKLANWQAQRKAAAAAINREQLDPLFPFEGIQFQAA